MPYDIANYQFDLDAFFPHHLFSRLTDLRVRAPHLAYEAARARRRRGAIASANGRVVILAADHPARMITAAGGHPAIMGDRQSYLGRILRVLTSGSCDGILGTPDILEDLFFFDHLIRQAGGPSFLDDKVMVGTMNRGGLAGAAFEMDDTFTAYTVESMVRFRLDAAKVMFRLDPAQSGSLNTITACARATTDCVEAGLTMFIEPLPVEKTEAGYRVLKTPDDIIRVVGIASGLGASSLNTWIKIPYCADYARVARATTCPILMLGGESTGDPSPVLYEFAEGMAVGNTVRGALVGRNVHHPGSDDPAAVMRAIYRIVHEGASGEDAIHTLTASRDVDKDALTKHFAPC